MSAASEGAGPAMGDVRPLMPLYRPTPVIVMRPLPYAGGPKRTRDIAKGCTTPGTKNVLGWKNPYTEYP